MHAQHALFMGLYFLQLEIEEKLEEAGLVINSASQPLYQRRDGWCFLSKIRTKFGSISWESRVALDATDDDEKNKNTQINIKLTDDRNTAVIGLVSHYPFGDKDGDSITWKLVYKTRIHHANDVSRIEQLRDFVDSLELFEDLPPANEEVEHLALEMTENEAKDIIILMGKRAIEDRVINNPA